MGLTFIGDVFLPTPYSSAVEFEHYIPNLEYPVASEENPHPAKVNLRSDQLNLFETFGEKPAAVCLANNHIMDFGEKGYLSTIEQLEEHGIPYYGAGYQSENYNNRLVIEIDGRRIGLVGYVTEQTSPIFATVERPGVVKPTRELISEDVDGLRDRDVDSVVASIHWGAEDVYTPRPRDVALARDALDMGIDLIVGHHSHRVQPITSFNGGLVCFGLGNCIMPDLDIPSYYDDTGTSTQRFTKKQYRWNRQSLGVEYSPDTHNVAIHSLRFEDGVLHASGRPIIHHKLAGIFLRYRLLHTKIQPIAITLGKAKRRIRRAIEDPSRITVSNIRSCINSISENK